MKDDGQKQSTPRLFACPILDLKRTDMIHIDDEETAIRQSDNDSCLVRCNQNQFRVTNLDDAPIRVDFKWAKRGVPQR